MSKDIHFLIIHVDLIKNKMETNNPFRQIVGNKRMLKLGQCLSGIFIVWVDLYVHVGIIFGSKESLTCFRMRYLVLKLIRIELNEYNVLSA